MWPFTRAKKPEHSPAANPSRLFRIGFAGPRAAVSYRQSIAAAEAMLHPSVHRCLRKLASSVQTVDWQIVKDKRANRAADDVRGPDVTARLQATLDNPSDEYSDEALRYLMALYLAAYGKFYLKIARDTQGLPSAIYILSPARVKEINNTKGVVIGYQYTAGAGQETFPTRAAAKGGEGQFPPYGAKIAIPGMDTGANGVDIPSDSPLSSLGLPMQVIEQLMQRAVDTASGHPNSKYIVTTPELLTREQEESVVRELTDREAGGADSGRVLMLSGKEIKVTKLDNDLSDLHSKVPLDDMERRIAAGFGIPPAMLGLNGADGAKFAQNYGESRLAFWEDTVDPSYLVPIERGLTAAICSPGWEVRFNRGSVPAMQDAIAARLARLEVVSTLSIDEKRDLAGMSPAKSGTVFHTPKTPPTDKPAATAV